MSKEVESEQRQSTAHDAFIKAPPLSTFSLPSNFNNKMPSIKQYNNRPQLSKFMSKWLTQQSLEETAFAEEKFINIKLPSINRESLDATLLLKEIYVIVSVATILSLACTFFLTLYHTVNNLLYSCMLAGWLLFLAWFIFGRSDIIPFIKYMRLYALVMPVLTVWSYSRSLDSIVLSQILACILFFIAERLTNIYEHLLDEMFQQRQLDRIRVEEAISDALDRYSNQRSLFLSIISQEIRDAGLMVRATLEQFSPSSILSNTHELLSTCSIAVPIASISAINTTIQEACHISSHLNLISKMLRDSDTHSTIPEEKIIRTNVKNEFDVGELLQNVGDALAGMSANLGVHFVIYHVDNGFYYPNVIGDEDAIKHSLTNLLRNILEGCTPGACIELGLFIAPIPDTPKVKVTFEITQIASPAIPIGLSAALIPNANFTTQLLNYIGGKMELEDLGKNKTRMEISLELYPGSNTDQRLLLIEKPSQILEKQLSNIRFSNEPTLEDLSKFITQLKGVKLILHAPEKSLFAKHLTSCLTTWNTDISHLSVLGYTDDEEGSSDMGTVAGSDSETSSVHSQSLKTPLEKHATLSPVSSRSINSVNTNGSKIPSPAIAEDHIHSIPPAFILIDDDILTLERKLREFRDKPPVPLMQSQQPQQPLRRHHRSKSRQNGLENPVPQGTVAIIFFTSLINYKRVRDTIHWFNSISQPPYLPRIVVVPKPAGPRRFLTALHTAWYNAIVEPQFIPIATSPLSPFMSPHCTSSSSSNVPQDHVLHTISSCSTFVTPGVMTPHENASRFSPGRRPPGAPPSSSALRPNIHSPSNPYIESEKGGYFFDPNAANNLSSKLNNTSPLLSATVNNTAKKIASPVLMPLNTNNNITTTTTTTTTTNGLMTPSINSSGPCMNSNNTSNATPNEIKRRIRTQSNSYMTMGSHVAGRRNLVDLSTSSATAAVSPSTLLSINYNDPMKCVTCPEEEGKSSSLTTNSCSTATKIEENAQVIREPIIETVPITTTTTASSSSPPLPPPPPSPPLPSSSLLSSSSPVATTTTTTTVSPSVIINENNISPNKGVSDNTDLNLSQQISPSTNVTTTSVQPSTQNATIKSKPTKFNFKLSNRKRKGKSNSSDSKQSPPISVLIVEDNMINQAILSTWMKKHSIKFSVASDGKEAVEKWSEGGFHLILMDIQLPVMDGIAATKMIRSIEKERKIGVLPSNSIEREEKEKEEEKHVSSFQSPVIIVALTASSLESDRQAALAAGCNDFLTKPVSLEWLEKKIMEWGCMQALIDFEGWRKWKRSSARNNTTTSLQQHHHPSVVTNALRLRKDNIMLNKEALAAYAREKEQLELRTREMMKDESRAIILLGINKRKMSTAILPDTQSSPTSRSGTPPPPPLPLSLSLSLSLPQSSQSQSQLNGSVTKTVNYGQTLHKTASDHELSIPKQVEAREQKRLLEEERLMNQQYESE
ncbi:uncharacterized protein BX663DRAFT_474090 [Cokeromyces recurvatus]|uniref:uncharacterized protein n=1 Tax=Cokeromyces recurvatus TaxID=90255 RepID=UPI00221F5564|nr:uncharacterized protein BX663DRAFT_474090 [Cokeromyces recurvatus]KAI7902181.1 hypothetical protein BX663DRAFT_474090 [Cokeromyces recurvatus]